MQIHQFLYQQIRKLVDLGDYHKMMLSEERKIFIFN